MIKIGITGQIGFIGSHLFNTLGLYPDKFIRVPFDDSYFYNDTQLQEFVKSCDVIVHLAAMNRHSDMDVIYNTNITLINKLIFACESTNSIPHIIFSSSIQEEKDNLYGKSKKEGRKLLENWASGNLAQFTGFIIPNVFGPFGKPYYNSVVATFCHQLTHNEQPIIDSDGELQLIFVAELISKIIDRVEYVNQNHQHNSLIETIQLESTAKLNVSSILKLLNDYKLSYFEKGEIPHLATSFERNLFNTFVCYIDHKQFFPFHLEKKSDNRGSFVETIKLGIGGQVSFSTTYPGILRGNHFHTRKAERFAVIKGKGLIELRRIGTDKTFSFVLDGENPSFVDMPIWYTHNIKNIGDEELYTLFWISEFFNPNDSDTFIETV